MAGLGHRLAEVIVDRGDGPPLVVVPGIQGRWEYIAPTVEALSAHFRVLTFPLDLGKPRGPAGVDAEVETLDAIFRACRLERAIICGISYGGAVASCFAAQHPSRTAALIVASAPGAGWHLRPRHAVYARWPLIFGPLFLLETPFRLRPELAATFPDRAARWKFARWQLRTLRQAPFSLARMAERARSLGAHDIAADCRRVHVPALVVTGEPGLDKVVPVESTATYIQLIRGASSVVVERTGHLGCITRPDVFAAAMVAFVRASGVDLGTGPATRWGVA
jgi:3-oxoadipate enol-lactonase